MLGVLLPDACALKLSGSVTLLSSRTVWPQDVQDSSEEEEEGQNEYDLNDKFLVGDEDEDEEDEEEEVSEEEKKRRRRKRRKEAQLDEEDYELIVRPCSLVPNVCPAICL